MLDEKAVLTALRDFAEAVTVKMTQLTVGEPEDQLRSPFETFMEKVGHVLTLKVVCTGETLLSGRMGKPDYAVHSNKLLTGYVELKAPGIGANPTRFTGHNREQWKRFKAIPNLIYCDGNDWSLYRNGEAVRPIVRLSGDVATKGKKAIKADDAQAVLGLLTDFLAWRPIIPKDVKDLANLLAPLCRMLRDNVTDALKDPQSPLVQLAKDWRELLFPDATNEQFADAYAQTVTFALLLAQSEGTHPLTLASAETALASEHSLLSRALQVLTDPTVRSEISASLNLLIRLIGVIPQTALAGPKDPWIYFYEDFLAAYDPKLRKDAGAYYTPVEIVHAQVRLVDDLLTNRLGKVLGFAHRDVVTLDPAVGTGTYLLGVIDHALRKVQAQQGRGAVPGQATAMAKNIYGFEKLVGPFSVSELRVSRALQDKGAKLPTAGTHVYLTDTLESPYTTPPQLPLYLQPIAEQHKQALEVKERVPVIVCLGNPPYDRTEAAVDGNRARTGGWIRWGDDGEGNQILQSPGREPSIIPAIFRDFLDPAIAAGHGVRVHNLYNLYVYFWRWALWKVFEHKTASGPGVVSFISASSYLDGDAFCGMREHMRHLCDEIWILDLGGEGRGTRKSENVFAIQTPVAIAIAANYGKLNRDIPARVYFARIDGTREEKLKVLENIRAFTPFQWQECPNDWQAPFRPSGIGAFFDWPLLTDLLPWQQAGIKAGRTWVIAPNAETLKTRWRVLCNAEKGRRVALFKNSPTGRQAHHTPFQLPPKGEKLKEISELPKNAPPPDIVRYAYRSFDRQYLFADARLLDRPSPGLWAAHGERQLHLTTAFTQVLTVGPGLTASAEVPDLHHFSGRGAKDIVPLYRDAHCKEANVLPGLIDMLSKSYGKSVSPEDFVAYVYGVLGQPAFTRRYAKELETHELRVPVTKDAALFSKVRDVGAKLLCLHTYGQRFLPKGSHKGHVPKGEARCVKPVSGEPENYPGNYEYDDAIAMLRVGDGEFAPVSPDVYEFEVSGLKVVQSWLKYRMKSGAGKKSSPLDDIRPERWTSDFTTEFLELLWILEATLAEYPAQAKLLSAVVKGACFRADELPPVPDHARKRSHEGSLLDQPERSN
jgi:hypothetical protein